MRQMILVMLLFLSAVMSMYSQTVEGIWQNYTDDEIQSHIKVYVEDGKLYGKVVKMFPHTKITHCKKCKGEQKGARLDEIFVFWDLTLDGKNWDHGRILDPKSGKNYACQLELEDANTLKIRGYVGKPIFGRSFSWHRVE